jgi:hypothetical protein
MLQDHFEEYIDVSVGCAKKIDPEFLVEEGLDYLIIGDVIKKEIPSLEIQTWLLKYCEISNNMKFVVRSVSGFCVTAPNASVQALWIKFIEDNIKAEIFFPPLLELKLNVDNLSLENGTSDLLKKYTDSFIEYIIENENDSK